MVKAVKTEVEAVVTEDFDIMPTPLVVTAMRDSGYKNAAYAIAELVDNAVQAEASLVEIVCVEHDEFVRQRARRRVQQIAVIDNGEGMDAEMLRKALQFGNGGRLGDRSGIGRFGMGLPNSSISQAKRVDVWTWQSGYANAIHCYLDISEIERKRMREVPKPSSRKIPEHWLKASESVAKSTSGTIVVWSELDKCDWRTAHAIFRNSEYTIGRIYRRFLTQGKLQIRMAAFMQNSHEPHTDDRVQPNDPLYLLPNTSCPQPWDKAPMFEPYGKPREISCIVKGRQQKVVVTFSVAKREARAGFNAGDKPHGKHAKNNIGVSIVRADRELELQTGWCNQYDPRERWWGIEVDFPPSLDEVFGVTNNKQDALALAEFATHSLDQIAEREGYKSENELIEAWREDDDPRLVLVEVKNAIEGNLRIIRDLIKAQGERQRGLQRHGDASSAETRGTRAIRERQQEGIAGSSDAGESSPAEEREKVIQQTLKEQGLAEEEAKESAHNAVSAGQKFEFFKADIHTPEFFTVRPRGGVILIGLNTNHPAYDNLVTLLEVGEDEGDTEALKKRLKQSYEGLKLLLEAWARYEDEVADGPRKQRAQDARLEWGRVARQFFEES
jgi:hypothetical protein